MSDHDAGSFLEVSDHDVRTLLVMSGLVDDFWMMLLVNFLKLTIMILVYYSR